MQKVWCFFIVILLAGCASTPPAISRIPPNPVKVSEVRAEPKRFTGVEVRWGGLINSVENRATHTWVEIVARELDKRGRPIENSHSSGRFIASFSGFLDPEVYKAGRLLTIIGTIEDQTTRVIGNYNYLFPVVTVSSSYFWPKEPDTVIYEYPPSWWYYDPWPYYRYPYPYPHRHKK